MLSNSICICLKKTIILKALCYNSHVKNGIILIKNNMSYATDTMMKVLKNIIVFSYYFPDKNNSGSLNLLKVTYPEIPQRKYILIRKYIPGKERIGTIKICYHRLTFGTTRHHHNFFNRFFFFINNKACCYMKYNII